MSTMETMAFTSHQDIFNRLAKVANLATLSPAERMQYDYDLKKARDYHAEMKFARNKAYTEGREEGLQKGREEGMQKGIEKGMQKGIEKGMQKGIEEGLQKGIEKGIGEGILKTARNLKTLGASTEMIACATGLSEAEIAAL